MNKIKCDLLNQHKNTDLTDINDNNNIINNQNKQLPEYSINIPNNTTYSTSNINTNPRISQILQHRNQQQNINQFMYDLNNIINNDDIHNRDNNIVNNNHDINNHNQNRDNLNMNTSNINNSNYLVNNINNELIYDCARTNFS